MVYNYLFLTMVHIPDLKSYQDYVNVFQLYFCLNYDLFNEKPQFYSEKLNTKILPYITINENGIHHEVIDSRYFSDNYLSNIIALDIIQNPYVNYILSSNLIDNHLAYINENHVLNYDSYLCDYAQQFLNRYQIQNNKFHHQYYELYKNNDLDSQLSQFQKDFIIIIKAISLIINQLDPESVFFTNIGGKSRSSLIKFSHLFSPKITDEELNKTSLNLFQGFLDNHGLLNDIFNTLNITTEKITTALHSKDFSLIDFNNYFAKLTLSAETSLLNYSPEVKQNFQDFYLFINLGMYLLSYQEEFLPKNTNETTQIEHSEVKKVQDLFFQNKFIFNQNAYESLALFVSYMSKVQKDDLSSEKEAFLKIYQNSIEHIEQLYQQFNVSLFNSDTFLTKEQIYSVLPYVLQEINKIVDLSSSFYDFKLNGSDNEQFKETFKTNLVISLCQNKVQQDMFLDFEKNYHSMIREIELKKILPTKDNVTQSRVKI